MVEGRVQVVVDAWDQVNGNRPRRRLGLYRLGYQVLTGRLCRRPASKRARDDRFDRFTADADAAPLVYAPGSGIPFYGARPTQFLYAVTNTLRAGVAASRRVGRRLLPPGDYTLRILAADSGATWRGRIATCR